MVERYREKYKQRQSEEEISRKKVRKENLIEEETERLKNKKAATNKKEMNIR